MSKQSPCLCNQWIANFLVFSALAACGSEWFGVSAFEVVFTLSSYIFASPPLSQNCANNIKKIKKKKKTEQVPKKESSSTSRFIFVKTISIRSFLRWNRSWGLRHHLHRDIVSYNVLKVGYWRSLTTIVNSLISYKAPGLFNYLVDK